MMEKKISIGSGVKPNPTDRVKYDNVAMQMAAITYCSVGSGNTVNNKSVANTLAKYLPQWQLVWSAGKSIDGNYAFIAYTSGQYIVAIRGSILNFSSGAFDNWFKEDLNVMEQVDWLYPANSYTKPMISAGSADGLLALSQLTDSTGLTILQFLVKNAIKSKANICITGHSLGGNLATVFGPWLYNQLQQQKLTPPTLLPIFTFAAPASFNSAFNTMVSQKPFLLFRYYNVLDIIPLGANRIVNMGYLFPSYPATSTMKKSFDAVATLVFLAELYYSSYYTQPTNGIPLNSTQQQYPVSSTNPVLKWFEQASAQHDHSHYLDWLKTPEINCVSTKKQK